MREAWATDASRAEQRAQLAGDELVKRGLPRDPAPAVEGEQTSLFTVLSDDEAAQLDQNLAPADPAQQILEIAVDPREPYLIADAVRGGTEASELSSEEPAMSVDPAQGSMFEAAPTPADVAAERLLRDPAGEQTVDGPTVREARRQAEILTNLNAQRAARRRDPITEWQRERAQQAESIEQGRDRRDQGIERNQTVERDRALDRDRLVEAGPDIGLDFD